MLPLPLTQLDTTLTSFINVLIPHNAFFNSVFAFLSISNRDFPLWIAIAVVLFLMEEKHNKKFFLYFLVAFSTTFLLVNIVMKNVVQRARPAVPITSTYHCPKDYSFPSTHAASAFATATILAAFDPKRRAYYFIFAGLVALSRIYLYCHFFLDVLAGGAIGTAISYLTLWGAHRFHTDKKGD
ncbi:phosphatase PAP2 family protein [Candidatus Roizmanbacteria bacterium]|nr:phosphatase PAP2 family protein [Candidatus Roizmanbacteria bacterium]